MAQGLAGSGNQRRYGTLDGVPDIAFAGGLGRGGLAGAGLAGGFDGGASQFSPTELFNLCENITTNIYTINSGRKNLEKEQNLVGTGKDSKSFRERVHATLANCNQLVTQTTQELARLTDVVRRGNKQQKLQAERLCEEFSQAVNDYSKAQKGITEKMKIHLLPVGAPGSPDKDGTEDDSEQLVAAEQQQYEQKLKQRDLEFEAGLMEERTQRVLDIEKNILDINDIMRDLSAMVYGQRDTVSSLEDNVENAHGNVETGRQELQKAASYQNKYRRKMMCLLMTALIAATILGVIIYLSVKR